MGKDFKWREVSEAEREEIRKESKSLLNRFADKLDKVNSSESHFENGSGTRPDGTGWKTDEEFRNIMFANAPFVDEEFIIAEKGGWK